VKQLCLEPAKIWHSGDFVKLQELHTSHHGASDCPQPRQSASKQILLQEIKHGEICTTTPLHVAIEEGDLGTVKFLVEDWGLDIHALVDKYMVKPHCSKTLIGFEGASPLFAAALFKQFNIVRYLVEHGADVSARTSGGPIHHGLTSLHAAFFLSEQHTDESEQLKIICFLVDSGADPSVLSSNEPILEKMIEIVTSYAESEGTDFMCNTWINPNAIFQLIKLGMSVTQKCPSGRTVLHNLACHFFIENLEDFIQLLLKKEANLNARENAGLTPIMTAAIGNNFVPNISFLNYLLQREEIPTKDKIDALEVAAAVIFGFEMNVDLFHVAFDYLAQAHHLRSQESLFTPEAPINGRAIEWITSADYLQNIQQHSYAEFKMQTIVVRFRIYSAMSWKAVYHGLWSHINLFNIPKLEVNNLHDQLLDISLTMLETIRRFKSTTGLHEEGIWISTVEAVETLARTLEKLRSEGSQLFSNENLTTSLDLVLDTYQIQLDQDDDSSSSRYLEALTNLFSLVIWLPGCPTIESMRQIVSQNGRDDSGFTIIHNACHYTPAANLKAFITLLLKNKADPHTVEKDGNGVLHFLAERAATEENEEGIGAAARLLLDVGVHLDRVNVNRKTAAELYKEKMNQEDEQAVRLPDWLKEGVPKLLCQSARVIRNHNIIFKKKKLLPATLIPFVEMH